MKKLILSLGIASLAILALVATVAAVGPRSGPAGDQVRERDRDATPAVLGLTQAQVMELRQDGLSLAQIAERQNVDPQAVVAAMQDQWTTRIEARVANGAITASEANQLKSQVELQARNKVNTTTMSRMQGAAVGAGPMDGAGTGAGRGPIGAGTGARGTGPGTGTCDGTGR